MCDGIYTHVYIFLISCFCILIVSEYVFASDCDSSKNYPPLNQAGPSYSVPRSNLSKYFKCYPGEDHRKRWIIFLPGSTEEVHELYSWNWMKIMDKKQWPYCTLQLPEKGLGDLQIAAEYVVYAVRKLYKKATKEKEEGIRRKTRINIIGHSLGGTLPRFALRFWPDIRRMVYQLIAFGPTNHGTTMANAACSIVPCPVSVTQQRINSSFLCALNSYQETFPSIKYTNILSKFDEIVRPTNSSEINEKGVINIYIQDLCPLRIFSEHLGAGIYDYCGYYLTMNA
jgi:triacylglycerol esterase/lipase EstA (alpha/beta hydrolase family)